MKLFNYYKKAALYPSLLVLFFSLIHSLIANYEGNGLSDDSAIFMSIITSLFFTLLVSLLSLSIFLNKIARLYKNLTWNLLTWFLLPLFYFAIVFIHDLKFRVNYDFGFGDDFIFLLFMIFPYIIALCWTFIQYRSKITSVHIA
jgi:hypothetical protein